MFVANIRELFRSKLDCHQKIPILTLPGKFLLWQSNENKILVVDLHKAKLVRINSQYSHDANSVINNIDNIDKTLPLTQKETNDYGDEHPRKIEEFLMTIKFFRSDLNVLIKAVALAKSAELIYLKHLKFTPNDWILKPVFIFYFPYDEKQWSLAILTDIFFFTLLATYSNK